MVCIPLYLLSSSISQSSEVGTIREHINPIEAEIAIKEEVKNKIKKVESKKKNGNIHIHSLVLISNKEDVIKFYLQILKMKKKRPHMNTIDLLKKCYPNATKFIDDLVANDQNKNE